MLIYYMINFKFIVLLIFFAGSIFLSAGIASSYSVPTNTTEFRFVPRSFKEEQDNPVPLMDIYSKLFNDPSPWVSSFTTTDTLSRPNDESMETTMPPWGHSNTV